MFQPLHGMVMQMTQPDPVAILDSLGVNRIPMVLGGNHDLSAHFIAQRMVAPVMAKF